MNALARISSTVLTVCLTIAPAAWSASTNAQTQSPLLTVNKKPNKKSTKLEAPDFAYPKDVIATAEAFLKSSTPDDTDKQGKRVLALSEIVAANYSIDYKSIYKSIELGLDMAAKAREAGASDLAAMLYAYTAATACDATDHIPWGRETKSVRPADMTEWSREDFYDYADSLYSTAYDIATPGCPIKRFEDALSVNPIGYTLTPTVRDFIVFRAYIDLNHCRDNFAKRATDLLTDNSALAYYIKSGNMSPDELKKMCLSLKGAPGSEFAVSRYLESVNYNNPDSATYNTLLKLGQYYPNGWIAPAIETALSNQKRTMIRFSTEEDIVPGVSHPCKLVVNNIDTVRITAYGWKNATKARSAYSNRYFSGADVVRRFVFPVNADVEQKTVTDSIALPAGNYIFVYEDIKNSGRRKEVSSVFEVNPWRVFTYATSNTRAVVVVDALTGKPAQGISVVLEYYKRSKKFTVVRTTNNEGIAYFDAGLNGQVSLRDNLRGLFFDDCCDLSYYSGNRPSYDNKRATIVTDRNIYRPGDTVRWSAVVATDTATCADIKTEMRIIFPTPQESTSANAKQDTTMMVGPSDAYGRIEGSFVIPDDVATGSAVIQFKDLNYGNTRFNISEFKLRDLATDDMLIRLQGDSVFITGRTVNSARVGVSDIDIKLSYDFAGSTITMDTRSGANGKFEFALNRKKLQKKSDEPTTEEAIDERYDVAYAYTSYISFNIDAAAPDGRSCQTYGQFPLKNDCSVSVNTKGIHDTTKGLQFTVSGTCYTKAEKQDSFNVTWHLCKNDDTKEKILEGLAVTGDINIAPELLKDVTAGIYRIKVYATDCKSDTAQYRVTLYNPTKPELPDKAIIWMPTTTAKISRGAKKAPVLVGVAEDDTRLTWLTHETGAKDAVLKSVTLNRGYHTVEFDVPQFAVEDLYHNTIRLWAVKNGSTVSDGINIEYQPDENAKLNLECESFRDRTVPGSTEQWTLVTRRGTTPISAAVAVNIYNTQLDQFVNTPSLRLFRIKRDIAWNSTSYNRSWGFSFRYTQDLKHFKHSTLPAWLYTADNEMIVLGYGTTKRAFMGVKAQNEAAVMNDMAALEEVVVAEKSVEMTMASSPKLSGMAAGITTADSAVAEEEDGGATSAALEALNAMPLRTNTVLNALWAPILTTDSAGRVDISIAIPNQTSKWRMTATAWTKDLNTAYLEKTFVATKPILVAPNLPRFVRVGDTVNLVSAITNDTDSAQSVTYSMEAAGHNATGTAVIEPRRTYYVTTTVPITGTTALADSLVVTMRASNGAFGDGERRALPILTSSALVTESRNFYLNTTDTVYRTDLPQPKGSDFETELHFTNNPMWTVVESLPSIIEPTFDVAPSLAMSLYASLSAIDIATEHSAARSVIDLDKARKNRDEVIKRLNDLRTDGGFRWGKWSNNPDVYTTLCVLNWLDEDIDKPDVKRLTTDALRYVDHNIATKDVKITPDMTYTLVRSAYGRPSTVRGQQVFDATIKYILGNWKDFSLNEKSVAALILHRTGNHAMALTIMNSVVQFGTVTADRGLIFHNMPSITAYATMLTAMTDIMPDSPYIDAVRQALLYLRQGMRWSTSAYTAYAVRAISTGSTWVVNRTADDVRVAVDGRPIHIDSVAAHNGAIDIDIKGADASIERTPGTPAYGSIVTRYVAPLSDIHAFSDGEISVEKHIYAVDNNNRRVDIKKVDLHPGQRLVVSFTIKAARPLSGVILNDMRPAAFEPVDQISQYRYAGELGYFLENRDSATNIYLYFVPRGTYIVEYPVTINNTGTFTTGVATVTSTVDPDITAHSSSTPLLITESNAR